MSSVEILCAAIRGSRLVKGWCEEPVAERAGLSTRHFQENEAKEPKGIRLATIDRVVSPDASEDRRNRRGIATDRARRAAGERHSGRFRLHPPSVGDCGR